MSEVTYSIDGLKELDEALSKMGRKAKRKAINKAIRAGAKIVLEAAKEKVPIDTGTLQKSLGIAAKKSRNKDQQEVVVLARKGKNRKNDGFYAHMVEFGTKNTAPQPFLGPAAHEKAQEAIKSVGDTLQSELIGVDRD